VEDATNGFFVSCFVRQAEEIVVTGRKNTLEAQAGVKRKVHSEEDDKDGASTQLTLKRRRKRKK
jgi:hypothetical protein